MVSSKVAVLFARHDSVYKSLDCDVWDIARDARGWPGGAPVVAHPPCRAWGRLRHFSKPRADEKDLARWSVRQVRTFGGVLEHPAGSLLWADSDLPLPGQGKNDEFGGWTLPIVQFWWGHRAEKKTWLYVVGVRRQGLPEMPLILGDATHVIETRKRDGARPSVSKAEREHTPLDLAKWLLAVAERCR